MKRELGIARCGLACCLCSENKQCGGCDSGNCPSYDWCETRKCSLAKGLAGCWLCNDTTCQKGILSKIKPYGFTQFARKYGLAALLDCLERNEQQGVVYHRSGIFGDYDDCTSLEQLFDMLRRGSA